METTYWLKQTPDKPLFPDLIWSRPQNKRTAGKLLIVGGNSHGFSVVGQAYGASIEAGIGTVRAILPDSLQKTVGKILPEAKFAPSNKSESFATSALAEILAAAMWADGILLAGDLGRNSETAILVEKLLAKFKGQVTLVNDACDYITSSSAIAKDQQATTLVMTVAQLQRLLMAYQWTKAITLGMPLLQLVEILHDFTLKYPVNIVTKQLGNIIVAATGKISTTKQESDLETWRTDTATKASVWWLQNPGQTFEALTSSTCF